MYVVNIIDYDNMTDDYNDSLSININFTDTENDIDIIIPTILFKIPCGLSFFCLLSLIVYTLIKPLIRKKIKYEYIQVYE